MRPSLCCVGTRGNVSGCRDVLVGRPVIASHGRNQICSHDVAIHITLPWIASPSARNDGRINHLILTITLSYRDAKAFSCICLFFSQSRMVSKILKEYPLLDLSQQRFFLEKKKD